MKLLVTGGAGYIGSIVSARLRSLGHQVVVFDNLSTGFRANVPDNLIEGDILDSAALEKVFSQHEFTAVLHFAAKLIVDESERQPADYYANNVAGGINLLRACVKHKVKSFVFSSSAAVYGDSGAQVVQEDSLAQPMSPYGRSKLMLEQVLKDIAASAEFNFVSLRYFNVAGASLDGKLGPRDPAPTSLFRKAARVALGREPEIKIFGDDYATPDGSPVRDFIHVEDLASAHIKALDYLVQGKPSEVVNCGYGHGVSVREVIEKFKSVSARDFKVRVVERRAADIPHSIAANKKLKALLNWKSEHDNLEFLCRSAYDWEKSLEA